MSFTVKSAYFWMIVVVVASNYLVQFPLNDWLTLGAFPYPFSFLVNELTQRLYGPKIARKVVYSGFFFAVLLSVVLATPRIAFACGTGFLCSQLADIYLFQRLRRMAWWIAPLVASAGASLLDTVIFWELAFGGEDVPLLTWMTGDFLVKLGTDLVMLLPFRIFVTSRASREVV